MTPWIVTGKGHGNAYRPIGFVAIENRRGGLAMPLGQALSNNRQLVLRKLTPERQRAPGHFYFLPHQPTRRAMTAVRAPRIPRAGFRAAAPRAHRSPASSLPTSADWKTGHRISDTGPACSNESYSG